MAKKAAQKFAHSKAHEVKEAIPIEQILLQNKTNIKEKLRDSLHEAYDRSKSNFKKSDIEARKYIRLKSKESIKFKMKSTVKKL